MPRLDRDLATQVRLSRWTNEFIEAPLEREFQRHHARESKRDAIAALLLSAAAFLGAGLMDVDIPGWQTHDLPVRLGVASLGGSFAWSVSRHDDPAFHHRRVIVFGVVLLLAFTLIYERQLLLSNEGPYMASSVGLGVIALSFLYFVALPSPLAWKTATWLTFAAGQYALARSHEDPNLFEIARLIVLSGGTGYLVARGLNGVARRAHSAMRQDMLQRSLAQQAMDALRRAQQQLVLQERLVSIGTLTAGMAHEINNPANFARAGAQAMEASLDRFRAFLLDLADDPQGEVTAALNAKVDEIKSDIATVVDGTSRIAALVSDLRVFSRLDEADKKSVAVGQSLLSTVNLVRTAYSQTVDIRSEIDADPMLECWPAQLNQVFMNLIVNACQAIADKQAQTPGAGRGILVVRTRVLDAAVEIDVEDDGCGMPQDVVDQVFEPFFSTRKHEGGTGLGLSISLDIVKRHGGEMRLRSAVGVGSCVTVRLPLSGEFEVALSPLSAAPA